MRIADYEEQAAKTAIYPREAAIIYPTLGLVGESGEVAEKIKKVIRDRGSDFSAEQKMEIAKELGDVLWYLTALAHDLGFTLSECAKMNIVKLMDRDRRDALSGSGDNR